MSKDSNLIAKYFSYIKNNGGEYSKVETKKFLEENFKAKSTKRQDMKMFIESLCREKYIDCFQPSGLGNRFDSGHLVQIKMSDKYIDNEAELSVVVRLLSKGTEYLTAHENRKYGKLTFRLGAVLLL